MAAGKFHGVIAAQTPVGSGNATIRWVSFTPAIRSPRTRVASSENHQLVPAAHYLATAFGREATPWAKGLIRRIDSVSDFSFTAARQFGQHRLVHRITQRVVTVLRLGQPLTGDIGTVTPRGGIFKSMLHFAILVIMKDDGRS